MDNTFDWFLAHLLAIVNNPRKWRRRLVGGFAIRLTLRGDSEEEDIRIFIPLTAVIFEVTGKRVEMNRWMEGVLSLNLPSELVSSIHYSSNLTGRVEIRQALLLACRLTDKEKPYPEGSRSIVPAT